MRTPAPSHLRDDILLVEARREAALGYRRRVAAIVLAPAAQGRQKQALALALDTDLEADHAISLLVRMPLDQTVARTMH